MNAETPSEKTIVILDFSTHQVHIFKNVFEDPDDFLYAQGWDLDNCYYMVNPKQINIEI